MFNQIPELDLEDELPLPPSVQTSQQAAPPDTRTTRKLFPLHQEVVQPDTDEAFASPFEMEIVPPQQAQTQIDYRLPIEERLIASFPFPTIRPVQSEALAVYAKSQAENKTFTIIDAPTGSGKSGIGFAVAKSAEGGAYFLTSQNSLSHQMMDDFGPRGLVQIKGKRNYHCVTHKVDCGSGALLNSGGGACGDCPYRAAKNRFTKAKLGVTNYTYYIAETMYTGELEPREVLVLDEAHNIEREILSTVDIKVTDGRCEEIGVSSLPIFNVGQEWRVRDWLAASFIPKSSEAVSRLEREITQAEMAKLDHLVLELGHKLSGLRKLVANIEIFQLAEENEWLAWSDADGNLMIKPLSAAAFANEYLFSTAGNVLLMSATILDFKTFRRNLGIPETASNSFAVPSDFPKENRRIVYWPIGSMAYKDIEGTLPRMVERIERLLTKYNDRKGIIHTHTYRINTHLVEYLQQTEHRHRIVTHNSTPGSREVAIQKHMTSEAPTILMSPSMTEGLDLRDDLSRFQIIMKVPYPFLDAYNRARMERDPKWYQLQTALTLVQASGRSIRSAEDHAITIILDSGFERFLVQNQEILPEWWKEAIEFK